jgi:hypothetical protein
MRTSGWLTLAVAVGSASAAGAAEATCDPAAIEARSYALTTRAVAMAVKQPRHDWWDSFELGKYAGDLADLNTAVTRAAERALELDPKNLLGHSILARQYLVLEEPEQAGAAWSSVWAAGGAVAWTSTYYDVDGRDWFLTAVDRTGIRIYQWRQVATREERGFAGILEFPGPEDERFWRASAGCIDAATKPHASVAWADVTEIKAGNWVLWFKLARPVSLTSGRNGKSKSLKDLKVGLHGRTGDLEVYKPTGEDHLEMRGRGPAGYQDLVRRTIARFVDPEKRIALPPSKPGVGW